MLRRFGLPALILGLGMSLISPSAAWAKHHDRDDERWEHERHEWRERQPRFRDYYYGYRPGFTFSYGPRYTYNPGYYADGYYDRWHSYARGYYDRWGYWHPYGY